VRWGHRGGNPGEKSGGLREAGLLRWQKAGEIRTPINTTFHNILHTKKKAKERGTEIRGMGGRKFEPPPSPALLPPSHSEMSEKANVPI